MRQQQILKKADTFSANVGQIENLLLPGEANLGSAIGDFFNSLQEIVNSPSDLSARSVAVEKGRMLADTFVQTSNLISQTRDGILKDIERRTIDVNILTSEMANLNQQIASSGGKNVNNSSSIKGICCWIKFQLLLVFQLHFHQKVWRRSRLDPAAMALYSLMQHLHEN